MEKDAMAGGAPNYEDPNFYKQFTEDHLKTKSSINALDEMPKVLFAMTAGSQAFNLSTPASDRDYYGIYSVPFSALTSLSPPPFSFDTHNPFDFALYDAQKLCQLILKGNPKIVESIFADRLSYQSPIWKSLRDLGHYFHTQNTVEQYLGYAHAQIKDVERGVGKAQDYGKKYCHALRLLSEAARICQKQNPRVWFESGSEERERLMNIRKGQYTAEVLQQEYKQLEASVKEQMKNLPTDANEEVITKLNDWLIQVRKEDGKNVKGYIDYNLGGFQQPQPVIDLIRKHRINCKVLAIYNKGISIYSGKNFSTPLESDEAEEWQLGIIAIETDQVVSINPYLKRADETEIDVSGGGGDSLTSKKGFSKTVLYEMFHFAKLFSSGSPVALECFFGRSEPVYESPEWIEIKQKIVKSVSEIGGWESMMQQYLGVAKQLLMEAKNKRSIWEALRMMWEAENILGKGGKTLKVVVEGEGIEQMDTVAQMDKNALDFTQVKKVGLARVEQLRKDLSKAKLRKGEEEKELWNQCIAEIRRNNWRKE